MARVVVFRPGSLGDTLMALKSLQSVRNHFPKAHIALLADRQVAGSFVPATALLAGSGLYDEAIRYTASNSGRWFAKAVGAIALFFRLRHGRYDAVVYLVPSSRPASARRRDRWYFRAAGIKKIIGMQHFVAQQIVDASLPRPLPRSPSESELLFSRLKPEGFLLPPGEPMQWLRIGDAEQRKFDAWLALQVPDGGRRWLGLGMGSNRPVSRWPIERYAQVVEALIKEADIWPVCFGGPEDAQVAQALTQRWGRGYVAAGKLGLRAEFVALKRVGLFLGNDSGPIHMAAAASTTCVGVCASSYLPGLWEPSGHGHTILRTTLACEGCQLIECIERRMQCIMDIDVDRVIKACLSHLAGRP